MLVKFNPNYRTRWMFPRNIRKIPPWKIAQILCVLSNVATYNNWKGDQEIQDQFCKALVSAGLKGNKNPFDPHSGGPRTYYSQLKMLGLIFSAKDRIQYTIAGQDILDGKPPLPILQKLLLNLQYPSPYSQGPNVRIHPKIQVKPFVFVFELLRKRNIKYLSVNELQIALVYGHNRKCLNLCVEKIQNLRKNSCIKNVISNPSEDLYTPRTRKKPLEQILADLHHNANTAKNWLLANCLVKEDKINGENVFWENTDFADLIDQAINNAETFIPCISEESFQRRFGTWNKQKDTRDLTEKESKSHLSVDQTIILSKFYQFCGEHLIAEIPDTFIENLSKGYGFSKSRIIDTISPYIKNSLNFFQSTYHNLSYGGTRSAIAFERATSELLNSRLLFQTKNTGQKKRPNGAIGGYSDILVVTLNKDNCGLIDTKASPMYDLPHSDYAKMCNTYIQNYKELLPPKSQIKLSFVSYIAGGFNGNIKGKLKQITKTTSIGASACTAGALYKLALRGISKNEQKKCVDLFSQNEVYNSDITISPL